eukprot:g13111.t1
MGKKGKAEDNYKQEGNKIANLTGGARGCRPHAAHDKDGSTYRSHNEERFFSDPVPPLEVRDSPHTIICLPSQHCGLCWAEQENCPHRLARHTIRRVSTYPDQSQWRTNTTIRCSRGQHRRTLSLDCHPLPTHSSTI